MLEMNQRVVLEMVDPPWREVIEPHGYPCAAVGRPRRECETGIEPRHKRAEQHLHENETCETKHERAKPRGVLHTRLTGPDNFERGPQNVSEQDDRQPQMRGKPVLAHRD